MNSETKNCQNCKKDFTIESDDFLFYEKVKVPPPTFCPECRLKRRLIWRNERTLYKRTCDLCGVNLLSIFHQDSPYVIYCPSCWWSDKWNASAYATKYDPSKNFFEQYSELFIKVPRMALYNTNCVNADYCNYVIGNKNLYYSFSSHYNEDSGYLQYSNKCRNAYDCLHVVSGNNVIGCNYSDRIYNCAYLTYAFDCTDCFFGHDLHNCTNCIGCVNLRNASYQIFNKQYNKDEYQKLKNEIFRTNISFKKVQTEFEILRKNLPIPESYQNKCIDSTGNDLSETKNLKYAFCSKKSEDSKYLFINSHNVRNSMDINNVTPEITENLYEIQGGSESSNMKFSQACWNGSTYCTYCDSCFGAHNLFGCVGIKKAEYCILNYQYTKEEYEALLPEIISHMNDTPYVDKKGIIYRYGEFFPSEMSPFSYNESIVIQYFPLKKNEVLAQGFTWRDREQTNHIPTFDHANEYILSNIDESLAQEVFSCLHATDCSHQCPGAFKMTKEELSVYKRIGLPLPDLCPNCRHYGRLMDRGGFNLSSLNCRNCKKTIQTVFDPEVNIIYCKECFTKEVV